MNGQKLTSQQWEAKSRLETAMQSLSEWLDNLNPGTDGAILNIVSKKLNELRRRVDTIVSKNLICTNCGQQADDVVLECTSCGHEFDLG